jgi:NAD(P)-dependent dehydrogenase (short-subunit alcohol dehydrogenase family)
MDLRGNVALVTGAAGPVGGALSARLAGLGASVAVLDRRPDAVAYRIASGGGHVLALTADVADPHSVRAAVGRLLTAWERIDIVLTDADHLGTVGPAVAGHLPEAARTGSRGVADLVVLAGSPDLAEPAVAGLRQQFGDQPVRVEAVLAGPSGAGLTGEVAEQVLRLIGRPAPAVPATGRAR